jgi:hypothetical protein
MLRAGHAGAKRLRAHQAGQQPRPTAAASAAIACPPPLTRARRGTRFPAIPLTAAAPEQAVLRERGWSIAAVPYWEWTSLAAEPARLAHLAAALAAAGYWTAASAEAAAAAAAVEAEAVAAAAAAKTTGAPLQSAERAPTGPGGWLWYI